jgi:hypothetical protein
VLVDMKVNVGYPSKGVADQGWKLYFTSLIMVLGAGLIVVARIVIRLRVGKLMADDYTIIASLVSQASIYPGRNVDSRNLD